MTLRRRFTIVAAQLATVAVILTVWQNVPQSTAVAISRPTEVFDALRIWLETPVLRGYIWITVEEAVVGLALTFMIAIALAVLFASVGILAELCAPFLALIAALPKLALAPVFLVIFGYGTSSKVYFIAFALWFIPFQTIYTALTVVDRPLLNNTRVLGGRLRHLVWHVYVPSTLRAVLTSLRVTSAFALIAAVLAEFLASTGGIGYQIQIAQSSLQASFVIAGILIIAALALTVDRTLVAFERRVRVRWGDS
jgi:NitT/TauT family transport system permease protein